VISGPLLRQTLRAHRVRVAVLALAMSAWAFLMPVIYATFGVQMEVLLHSGIIPEAFLRLLGADPFSLNGAVALGAVHPVALGLQLVYPVGFAAAAIAGERQRGTLEVLLSRPVSRRQVFATLLLAIALFVVTTTVASLVGTVLGASLYGVADTLDPAALAFLAVNTAALLLAFGAVCLAASASADRLGGPIALGLALVLVGYVLEVLGTLWPDAAFLQRYSPFHYLRPLEILGGRAAPTDIVVLALIGVAATAFGLWHFPRRDLAAPT
jgi:ABC-2 type transport system permease protein